MYPETEMKLVKSIKSGDFLLSNSEFRQLRFLGFAGDILNRNLTNAYAKLRAAKKDPLKMVLTLQERIFIVENVFRDGGKYTKEVQESFQENFGAERLPHRNCVSALLHKFKKTGSVQDKPKSGRPKVVTDTVLQNVTNKLQRSPRKSLRRLSQETRISLTSTHRAVHQLKFLPYKVHVVHELKPQDSEKRVLFCRWFENFILEKDNPRTTDELKQKITSVIQNIKPDELECFSKHAASRSFMSAGEWRTLSTVIVDHILLHESILNRTLVDKAKDKSAQELFLNKQRNEEFMNVFV
ncbi:Macrophage migration inhibitory factor-like [Octopus vulgaris]|uniref:Macrophage migration inhibitory factor-like n=1 Tax=Octopus vulgaris TaxID=6645 RepID=A0AA36F2B8_OCTVU|nr:Macrophage migration inhibitory factor-like [Octopus vulgaris]